MNLKRIIGFTVFAALLGLWCVCEKVTVGCTKPLRGDAKGKIISEASEKEQAEIPYLKELRKRTEKLESYECVIKYLFSQPLLESKTLRKGYLYYQKFGDKSKLRINFETLQQDDFKEQKERNQYIFDGVWLTVLDYRIKAAKLIQQAEPNEPVNAFELARRNFPIIGFSSTEDLKKDFEIGPAEHQSCEGKDYVKFHLVVKPGSVYEEDYKTIDFWIDKELGLPAKIVAETSEGDFYEIILKRAMVNKRIDEKVFEVKIPTDFGEPEVIPLEKDYESQKMQKRP